MEVFDAKTIYTILHVFGAVLGAGAALTGDYTFLTAIKDKTISKDELGLLESTSRLTWIGLGLLIISGVLLFYTNPAGYLASSKFQIKMLIVLILTINGLLFNSVHLPKIRARIGKRLFIDKMESFMVFSGVLSIVSWVLTLILGSLRAIPYNFTTAFSGYLLLLAISFFGALLVKRSIMNKFEAKVLGRAALISFLGFVLIFAFAQRDTNKSDASVLPTLTPKAELAYADSSERHVSYAPEVPAPAARSDQRIFDVHLEVIENVCDLDQEGEVRFDVWGYRVKGDDEINCGAPGPVLRGRVGDVARITLTNLEGNKHPHNIDFHAVTGQGGGARDLIVAPGETASIEVRLLYPGAFMYHCAYGDVPKHISHGMYGMFIVDPEEPLPLVDHEWAVMQSEWYLSEQDDERVYEFDKQALTDEEPSYITFNGKLGALTGDNALAMNVGERARIYFVNEGLNLASNFHPIGSHWDKVYPEAATHPSNHVIRGSQSTLVVAGGGSVVELTPLVPSKILLVDHALSRTFYKGAVGHINVSGEENTEIFEVIKESGGAAANHNHDEEADTNTARVEIPVGAADKENASRAYLPRNLRVEAGTTVTWDNTDSVMHTVTSGVSDGKRGRPDGLFDSGFLRPGASFSYTFDEPGVYPYYCAPHPWATGTVIVE